jgi:hypothetical protein
MAVTLILLINIFYGISFQKLLFFLRFPLDFSLKESYINDSILRRLAGERKQGLNGNKEDSERVLVNLVIKKAIRSSYQISY